MAHAATTPPLGTASTFGIRSNTFIRNIGITTINGDAGYVVLGGSGTDAVSGTTHRTNDAAYNRAGADETIALSALNAQPCTFTFPAGNIDLAADTAHGTLGIYAPGVYCVSGSGSASIGVAGITLDGSGTYIFRIAGWLTSAANSNVMLSGGASACNVFWTPKLRAILGAGNSFVGTLIGATAVTVGHNTSWTGRALDFGNTITTDTDSITVPSCASTDTIIVPASGGGAGGFVPPIITHVVAVVTVAPAIAASAVPIVRVPAFPNTGIPPADKNIHIAIGLPIRLKIPIIGVDAAVQDLGIDASGSMIAPKGFADVAWYDLGARPGSAGSAVIAGHYGARSGTVFDDLYLLKEGDDIYILDDQGKSLRFIVREMKIFEPDADAASIFDSSDGKAHLNLITCQGVYSKILKTYSGRLVVFADAAGE